MNYTPNTIIAADIACNSTKPTKFTQHKTAELENKPMNNANFQIVASGQSPTLNDEQKEAIIRAILQAVATGNYYDGLEKKTCQAISNINRFSDGELITEAVDLQTGHRYRKVA